MPTSSSAGNCLSAKLHYIHTEAQPTGKYSEIIEINKNHRKMMVDIRKERGEIAWGGGGGGGGELRSQ